MKNTIIIWTMMVLLSLLTACGGSSDSGDSKFGSADPKTDTPTDTPTTGDGDTNPPIVEENNVAVALGVGFGNAFQPGIARVGLTPNESLSANGSTTISVDLVDTNASNAEFSGSREITFGSICSLAGLAEFSPTTVEASGSASVTYKDLGCGKEKGVIDKIRIYVSDEDDANKATAYADISVKPTKVGVIQFVSAEPSLIALSGYGAGDVPSFSKLQFRVLNRSGNPMPDRTVNLKLDHEFGGASLSLDKAITGVDGTVDVILKAGATAGNIRVKASVDTKDDNGVVGEPITTLSQPITMATSLGDQNSFSFSAIPFNPNGWEKDGSNVAFEVRVGDHYNNPVLDGTRVYFRSSAGLMQPSCETEKGVCKISWESSNPRPVDGYLTVVAYTRGQGDYQDVNGNGLFDVGESFTTYGESYLDANGNGRFETDGDYQPIVDIDGDGVADFGWDPNAYRVDVDSVGAPTRGDKNDNFLEELVDNNNNGELDLTPDNVYQGVNCSDTAFSNGHCAEQINIVGSIRLQMSQGNNAYIEGPFGWDNTLGRYDTSKVLTCVDGSRFAKKVAWRVADSKQRRNHLPSGTTVELALDDVETVASSGDGTVASVYPAPIWPVWRDAADAAALAAGVPAMSAANKKYHYLNARGHLIEADLLRAEDFTTITYLGTAAVKVKTVNGPEITAGNISVDLKGQVAYLSKNGVPQPLVDVSNNSGTYTVTLKNQCRKGLPIGAKLLIGLSNGELTAVASTGNTVTIDAASNTATIEVTSLANSTSVDLTIDKDTTTGEIVNALTIDYSVDDGSGEVIVNLNDFNIKD